MESQELTRLLQLEDWGPDDEKSALTLDEKDRVHLAKHIANYDGILIDLSHDTSVSVREAVASNKNTPVNILKKFSKDDKSIEVRTTAIQSLEELNYE
ncbi:hypothetical protein [Bacillus sp. AG4(2022)]|uniref:hypothetical protein n=1 Tax=Bacillus sp. AG4(2022) TaxID=2962594 RepID=UPI0028825559|nr:hypothetical protein [Bacillus sp. AG4(2022)]MDT0160702.1 hypothetical protein [Bacillus sp. AG4(2022)]